MALSKSPLHRLKKHQTGNEEEEGSNQNKSSHSPLPGYTVNRGREEGTELLAPPNLVLVSLAHLKLLHQVHICTFVFLHAALRDARHVCSQCSIDKHT